MKFLSIKKIYFFLLISLVTNQLFSQSEDTKWVFGIGINAVDYFPIDNEFHNVDTGNPDGFFNEITNAEDHWNISAPKVSISRHLVDKLSLELGVSLNKIKKFGDIPVDDIQYIGLDGNLQYSILDPEGVFVPFVLAGGGYTFADKSGGTVNGGVGANLWLSNRTGLNAQWVFKYNSPDFALVPHFYYSLTVVFKLGEISSFKGLPWGSRGGRGKRFMWRNGCF